MPVASTDSSSRWRAATRRRWSLTKQPLPFSAQNSSLDTGLYVTAADLKAEETLIRELQKARPGYAILAEERGLVEGTDKTHTWIIDPLDGTSNFVHAIPHFAVNSALEREGQIVAAVTYNPIAQEMFWAERGRGAYLNQSRRLRVAARKTMSEAMLATGIPYQGKPGHAQFLKELHQVMPHVCGVRRFGSAALDMAWVAAGRYDGYWERNLNAWDLAAGQLLVVEAGGMVSEIDGAEANPHSTSMIAANLDLHPLIVERIKAAS